MTNVVMQGGRVLRFGGGGIFATGVQATPTNGLAISGNKFVNAAGQSLDLRGVNLSALEESSVQGFLPWADGGPPDWTSLANWKGNIVRIPLCGASWLGYTCSPTASASLTFTAVPTGFGGTLTTAWTGSTGAYPITFGTTSGYSEPISAINLTNGSTAATWAKLDVSGSNNTASTVNAQIAIWGTPRSADPFGLYRSTVQQAIADARSIGCYINFDLHYTAPPYTIGGDTRYLLPSGQSAFADVTSLTFWTDFMGWLISTYGANGFGDMSFELFNEPYLDQNGYQITTTSGGSTFVNADVALLTGAWSSGGVNASQSGTNYILGMPWQIMGYQQMINAIRAMGVTNVLIVNGNGYTSKLQNYASYKPTDSLNQIAFGWHPYSNGSYPYGYPGALQNVFPGGDSGSTNVAVQWAQNIKAAGYPVIITEDGGQGGTTSNASPNEPHMAYMQWWATLNNVPYIAWSYTITASYGTSGAQNQLTVFPTNTFNPPVVPILGEGTTTYKWMTRDRTPMKCLSHSAVCGQATAGSTTTCTDNLQNWLVNAYVGATFIDNFTGQEGTISANTATTLTFSSIGTAVAGGDGYSIVTSQMIPYVNNNSTPAAYLTDPCGNNRYQTSNVMPLYMAFDISAQTAAGLKGILINWYQEDTYCFNPYVLSGNNPAATYYNLPGTYTIDTNTAAPGTYPTSGWVTGETITGNTCTMMQHKVTVGPGVNWVRMNVTVINGGPGNDYIKIKMDLYDMSYGITDGLFIAGDSITANNMNHRSNSYGQDAMQNYAAGAVNSSGNLVNPGYFNSYPFAYIAGGMAGWSTNNYDPVFNQLTANYYGKYMGFALGTNDMNGSAFNVPVYLSSMASMISKAQARGFIVIIAWIPWAGNQSYQAGYSAFLGAQQTVLATAGVVEGPNFFKLLYGYVSSTTGAAVTSGTGTTLTDTSQSWGVQGHVGRTVNNLTQRISHGLITANTATQMTFASGHGTPAIGDIYNLTFQNYTATGGSTTTITDSTQNWPVNLHQYSYICNVTRGWSAQVTSSNGQTITFPAQASATQAGDIYSINGQNMVTNGIDGSDGLHPGPNGARGQRLLWAAAMAKAQIV